MNDVNDRLALSSAQARQQFTDICNKYLYTTEWHLKGESKIPVVRNKYNNDPVQLLDLSSGERQIIHILSRIYLSAIGNLLVFFDEPEISLSIPWQQTILPDVLSSSNCAFLLAVTHSPFVFKNELDVYATGLSMHTTFRNGK